LQETRTLRQELQPIFFSAPPSPSSPSETEITDDASVVAAVERLYQLGEANDMVVRLAFSVSTGAAATSAVKTPQLWQSLLRAEALSAEIANAT
jgi:hypothetical protein